MAVRATVSRFPATPEALESCAVQWGVAVTPFAAADEHGQPPTTGAGGDRVPRCEHCWAYLSSHCDLERWGWTCALCGTLNGFDDEAERRFQRPDVCPELKSSFVDLEILVDEAEGGGDGVQALPVYVAAVDLACSEEFLELVKSALLAALEALVPGSLFGLMTFSHKIGLYDVQGPIPLVKNVFIPPDLEEDGLPVALEDAMPLLCFLAPVDTCKDQIAAVLETLRPTSSWERGVASGQEEDTVLLGRRGFGTAMSALIEYLSSEYGSTFALARVFAFLSGAPDYGAGVLDTRRYGEQYASKGVDADLALLPEQIPFYRDLAAVAVQSGVCIDIFAVTDEYTDLASLKFLSIESGGSLFLYASTDDSTVPQDIYRLLSRPYAFGCVLRLRTSSDFEPGNSYGHFFPDPQYENVQHIICCDSFATYAYDFEFAHNDGFSRHTDPAVVQIAFQYSVIEPVKETSGNGSQPSASYKFCLKRRLRIRTLQYRPTNNISEIYDSVDPEVVLHILVHKVILESLDKGVREGRHQVHAWLSLLAARYNQALSSDVRPLSSIDIDFSQCPQLQTIPQLVFALLRSPLLRLHEEGVHPDYRIYLQCLFSALEPSSVAKAIYPVLISYSSPDKQAFPRHTLSHAALIMSESPIFLLDTFTNLIVYYSSTADPSVPFPPPHDCLLRKTINGLKQDRCITPKLTFIHGGKDDSTLFESYLIEEQDVDGSGLTTGSGFVAFRESVRNVAGEIIQEEIGS
ncbi:sec23/sec24 transport family protein [Zea mays]|uniref:Sec23/sec24 transport family protein n=2 Tax=Zea mays TaxID=4577 RepID=K7UZ83_MAIZE|nr:sec23/sec24 transport family protein [Zea mays]